MSVLRLGPMGRGATVAALAVCLSGCGLFHNTRRFLHPTEYQIVEDVPPGEIASLELHTGWKDDAPQAYDPERTEQGLWPVDLSPGGWITVDPKVEDAELNLWVRRTGVVQQGWSPVLTITGARRRELPLEVRMVASSLEAPRTVTVDDLSNVYNDFRFDDGDLLMVELRSDQDRSLERYWFRHREVGLRAKGLAGLLVRVPLPFVEPVNGFSPSPALSLGLAVGWRPRSRRWGVRWLFDQVAVVGSVAIGSTAFDEVVGGSQIEDQVNGAFNAGLAGGGIEVLDFLSLQVLGNVSASFRDANETPATLAVGIDAVRFAAFARDAATRLLYPNTLSEPPADAP